MARGSRRSEGDIGGGQPLTGLRLSERRPEKVIYRAAVDKTLAYGADSALRLRPSLDACDPWGPDSFRILINALINHHECYYLLPTMLAAQDAQLDMPSTLLAARSQALISPTVSQVATDVELQQGYVAQQFSLFRGFFNRNPEKSLLFGLYHKALRGEHDKALPGNVLASTAEFWRRHHQAVCTLARAAAIDSYELRYLFDVAVRVVPYDRIADRFKACYFAHPIRSPFGMPACPSSEEWSGAWDWSSKIWHLLQHGRVRRDPNALMDLVGRIREQVLKQGATIYTLKDYTRKDQHDLLTAVACDAALPAVLKNEFLKGLGVAFGAAAEYIEKEPYKTVLKVLAGVLTRVQIRVPGSVTKRFKVLRGLFEWPDSGH